jgi:hypothetical protein
MVKAKTAVPVRAGEEHLTGRERAVLTRLRNKAVSLSDHDRWRAANHEKCPADALDILVDDGTFYIQRRALVHPNLSPASFARAWKSVGASAQTRDARRELLQFNPNAPVEYVREFPRLVMLSHPRCDAVELLRTACEGTVVERERVALNSHLNVDVQRVLSMDPSLAVRKVLSVNYFLTSAVIRDWVPVEKSPIVLRRLVRAPDTDTELAALIAARLVEINSRGRMTRVTVAQHTDDQEALHSLVKDADGWVASIAVMNKNLDEEGMMVGATNRSKWVRRNLVARDDITEEAAIAAHLMN